MLRIKELLRPTIKRSPKKKKEKKKRDSAKIPVENRGFGPPLRRPPSDSGVREGKKKKGGPVKRERERGRKDVFTAFI